MQIMKKKLFSFNFVLLVLLCASSYTIAESTEKSKVINKNYKVSANDKLTIENQFGKVSVETWDKNEIDVEITIKVSSKSESRTLSLLNEIDVNDIKINNNVNSKSVYLKTIIPTNTASLGKQNISIDYLVKMPATSPLNIQNKFGNVYMGDFKAALQLNVSYGSIKINKLYGDNKRISVSFGSADIDHIDEVDLESKYSKLSIEKINKGDIKNQFGKTYINDAGDVHISQKYGDLDIRKVNDIIATVEFSNLDIDALGKSADLTLKYSGNADLGQISSSVDVLKINAGFSTVYMKFSETADLDFNAQLRFGDLKINNIKINEYMKNVNENSNHKSYKGKIGKGGGGTLILDSNYSTIYFQ